MRIRAVLLVVASLLAAFTVTARQHRESVTVEVVDVPVYVSRSDKPVEGLTRDQFELFVNGQPQPIEYFDAVTARAEAPTLRERRLFLLLFDVAFSHPLSLPRAQRAAAELIEKAPPADYFAIATYSNRRGVWFAAPFTRDRGTLTRAIRSLNSSRSGDPLSIVMTASERATVTASGSMAADIAAEGVLDMANAELRRAAEDQISGLADVSERLAALEGQKHVVFLSEGWDGRNDGINLASMRYPQPARTASFDISLLDDLNAMHRRFQASGVFLHALDIEGVTSNLTGNDGMFVMSEGTGGKFVHGRNNLGGALAGLSASLDRGYRIGFRPVNAPVNAKTGYNTIEVRVRNAGRVHVDHRRGFSTESGRGNADDGIYLADVILNDVPQTGTAAMLSLRDGTLTAQIPMKELAVQGRSAELLVYAFAADGSALMFHREVIAVTDEDAKTFAIAVPEGTKTAKALLRVNGSLGFTKVGV